MVKIFTATAHDIPEQNRGEVVLNQHRVRCALGKEGVIAAERKREGDLRSPLGVWPVRFVYYRPDRTPAPKTVLPLVALTPDDGWCDDAMDEAYNQPVKLPYKARTESLWREDHVYDVIIVLGYNDDPVVPGHGSAIFAHVAREGYVGTEGCVAMKIKDVLMLLELAEPDSAIEIKSA
ncbi:L,D-transpeptidase family protein [Asticcacaulis endophyticus]|nr:L,D-transpeptidase family protein [Asticcacaulis endophyticus]